MYKTKNYLLSDLFEIVGTKSLDAGKLKFVDKGINFVGRINDNNGVQGKIDIQEFAPNEPNTLTVSVIGNYKYVKYQQEPYYCSQNINKLTPKFKINEELALYFITLISKFVEQFNGKQGGYKLDELKNFEIQLPIVEENGVPKTVKTPDWKTIIALVHNEGGGGVDMSNIDTTSWQEFKLGDLFVSSNGNVDLQKGDINDKGEYVVSSGVENRGIIGKTDKEAKVFNGNTLTVDMFGNVYYRPYKYKMVTHARVFSLSLIKGEMTEEIGLYLEAVLKYLVKQYSFSNMCTFEKIKGDKIKLPVIEEYIIDWVYMQERIKELEQERIKELEQERIKELEQYLVATGLNDYELTEEDIRVLSLSSERNKEESDSENAVRVCGKEMREFRIDNVLNVLTPKQRFNANTVIIDKYRKTGYAYVVRTSENNGIRGNIVADTAYLNNAHTFSFGQDTATIFWQTEPYFTGDKIKVLQPKYALTDEMAEYMLVSIQRAFSHFAWGQQSFSEKVICAMMIQLPIQTDAVNQPVIDENKTYHPNGFVPDWDYMNKYIRAIEKLVIADVVKYKDEMIEKTKEVVEK